MHTFKLLLQGVLDGSLSLETCEGVAAWPPEGGSDGRLAVLLHRSAPGAMALAGTVQGHPVMDVVTLPRLAEVCIADKRVRFERLGPLGLLGSEITLFEALWAEADGAAVPLIWVPGADGVLLLRDVSRLLRGALH